MDWRKKKTMYPINSYKSLYLIKVIDSLHLTEVNDYILFILWKASISLKKKKDTGSIGKWRKEDKDGEREGKGKGKVRYSEQWITHRKEDSFPGLCKKPLQLHFPGSEK